MADKHVAPTNQWQDRQARAGGSNLISAHFVTRGDGRITLDSVGPASHYLAISGTSGRGELGLVRDPAIRVFTQVGQRARIYR